jgi:hypothetical protein
MERAHSIIAEWERKGNVEECLNLGGLRLETVPVLPPTVKRLSLFCNNLTEITFLPDSILGLDIACNRPLHILCKLPPRLEHLYCSRTSLPELPELPATLRHLSCRGVRLTSLPVLPPNLSIIDVAENSLQQLPELPFALDTLICNDNQLTTMPYLPPKLIFLLDYNNPFQMEEMRWDGGNVSEYQTDTRDQIQKWLAHTGDKDEEERKKAWDEYLAIFE